MPGRESFPRRERLTRSSDFSRIYREGRRCGGEAFICYVVRRAGQGRKMGCSVSRKVGNAVARNRVKRYIREIYRTHRRELRDDVHLVVVAKPGCASLNYRQCEDALRQVFQQGEVLGGQDSD